MLPSLMFNVFAETIKGNLKGLMTLPNSQADSSSSVYFVNFNQDCTSLSVGTKTGYRIFSLSSVDSLEQIYEDDTQDCCIVERLFSSSLVAVVSLSSPRKLKVCHFKRGTEICNYSYSNTILSVKLNRIRLVVCLEEALYIHNIRDMKVLHTIRDTPPNVSGLCALSVSSENCYLAYPGSSTIGEVQIFDCSHLRAKIMIPAHNSPLAALAFTSSGARLATASEKGTVIRVFNVADGTRLFEFRRGLKRCVRIANLLFSTDSQFLTASSNTETVHIFRLDEPQPAPVEDNAGWMGYLTKAATLSAKYLPTQVTDVFSQGRSCVCVHLPVHGYKTACAVATIQRVLRLLVASTDGFLYIYNLDTSEGGETTLVKQYRLDGKAETITEVVSVGGENPPSSNPLPIDKTDSPTPGLCSSSYAGILKGHSPGHMSGNSEKFHEMNLATSSPPKDGFRLTDDSEFPPVSTD
ncbi:WD repeat domain phosphoinositide-interacting protein 2-like isoform X3 [Macrosteles quadrilineatus]|uniref:WD repeat domain phosphoinositide-interacting protein 2-like isoform X3 n=1 Tax=Macrosteles quadrilineatus TaxID=74068 RepID=UPI0023E0FDA3|nr:WD repeat domain phosphoinositide-interacting protein 2-like isoform X3 [Macrosteles quadrilineatus]